MSLNLSVLQFVSDHFKSYSRCYFAPGLPPSGSWQDLKDHMREAGDVCYADVYRDGTGVVEYVRKEDMSFAIRKLDNTKFRSHEVSRRLYAGLFRKIGTKKNLKKIKKNYLKGPQEETAL